MIEKFNTADFIEHVSGKLSVESDFKKNEKLIPAAVLVAIVDIHSKPGLVFTRRSMTVSTHKGQISFPGGMIEPEDKTIADAAKREAKEEINLDFVTTVGFLPEISTVSNYTVQPVVGYVQKQPIYKKNPDEVDEIFEVTIEHLADIRNFSISTREYKGITFQDHSYRTPHGTIWGATGKILTSFFTQLDLKKFSETLP